VSVDKSSSLLEAMKDPRYKVMGGTPSFIILVDKSPFQSEFLGKYA
jgi:L-fucose isomerase-like protein